MEKKSVHLQDEFLNQLRKEHVSVSIYLMNGIKLQGNIESFDQYAILLKNTVSQLVYKHAISTIVPLLGRARWRPMSLAVAVLLVALVASCLHPSHNHLPPQQDRPRLRLPPTTSRRSSAAG